MAILRAAFELLGNEQGRFARVEEGMLAAKMARGTFYNYFDSREDLLNVLAYELGHDFNNALLDTIAFEKDVAKQAAMAIRYYLRRARQDHNWGWAVVNVSINTPKFFGEESFEYVNNNVKAGIASGEFSLDRPESGSDLIVGTTLAALNKIFQERSPENYPEEMTLLILRALGVSSAKAKKIAFCPLPSVKPYPPPFTERADT